MHLLRTDEITEILTALKCLLFRNLGRRQHSVQEYEHDGLNSLNYSVVSYREMSLYTRIAVNLLYDASTALRTTFISISIPAVLCVVLLRTDNCFHLS